MIRIAAAAVFFALAGFLFFSELLGLFKFRYVMDRIHAAALGDTLGIVFVVLGVAILGGVSVSVIKLLLIPAFMFLTSPVITHLIAQAEVLYRQNQGDEYEEEYR